MAIALAVHATTTIDQELVVTQNNYRSQPLPKNRYAKVKKAFFDNPKSKNDPKFSNRLKMQLMLMEQHFAQLLHFSKLNQITVFTLEGLIGLSLMSPKKLLLLLLQLHSADWLQQSTKLKAKNETAKKIKALYIQIV